MKEIVQAVDRDLLLSELTRDKFLRKTNFGGNEIYVTNHLNAPNVMREIGRLREISFRAAGGGTGNDIDIDRYDVGEKAYQQLVVWNPGIREILGGYRFFLCTSQDRDSLKPEDLATHTLFHFSDRFIREYLPYTMELGRSFVQPDFQSTGSARRSVYALDNLWDGLGAIAADNPEIRYFFGKVTMYTHFNQKARNMILFFLKKYFPDPDMLVTPKTPIKTDSDDEEISKLFTGGIYKDDYRILSQQVRSLGETIPPLVNAYMNLSETLRVFGTALNNEFGGVEETGMMIHIRDLRADKVERYVNTYLRGKQEASS